jgi:spore coat polysaccharide biosynthesis predicted glycosyltransferase SpsG
MYDAMLACWKQMLDKEHHAVVSIINDIYKTTDDNEPVWTKSNILCLTKYVALDDVFKLLACYFAVKHDPSVLVSGSSSKSENIGENNENVNADSS